MYKKMGRLAYRSNRKQGFKKNSSFSNGRVRNKGNVFQQYQKYLKLAKEASSSGDRIQTEYYYQFTEHYSRLMLEMGIPFVDEEGNKEIKIRTNNSNDEKIEVSQNTEKNNNENENENENENTADDLSSEDNESIESVSFISEPTKKKSKK